MCYVLTSSHSVSVELPTADGVSKRRRRALGSEISEESRLLGREGAAEPTFGARIF